MKTRNDLTVEYVRSLFDCDPIAGKLFWKINSKRGGQGRYSGKEAGFVCSNGYRYVSIDKKWYLVHRIIFLHINGRWPLAYIDHVSGDRSRNSEIREANPTQSAYNRRRQSNNTSGFKGVSWHAQSRKWRAQIWVDGAQNSLGLHATPEQAFAAYCEAAKKFHGEFARFE